MAGSRAGDDLYPAPGSLENLGEKIDAERIRRSIDGRGCEPYLEIAVHYAHQFVL